MDFLSGVRLSAREYATNHAARPTRRVDFHEQTQRTWLVVRRRNSSNPTDMRPIARPKVLIAASACPSAGDGEEDRTL